MFGQGDNGHVWLLGKVVKQMQETNASFFADRHLSFLLMAVELQTFVKPRVRLFIFLYSSHITISYFRLPFLQKLVPLL